MIPALICITLHELSHGYIAYCLGDPTAKERGRLTLNPLRHIDLWGLITMIVFHFGWAKPVPVNMYRFRNPKRGMAITALAGPLANVVICVVFLLLYGLFYIPLSTSSSIALGVLNMLQTTAYLSLALAIFNLIPIPPLDGSKLLFSFLPDRAYQSLMRYERYGTLLLFFLIVAGSLSDTINSVVYYCYDRLFFLAEFAFRFGQQLFL
ncbi:MAG: site-2 protease family protein [Oscillospiraceae bacterium]